MEYLWLVSSKYHMLLYCFTKGGSTSESVNLLKYINTLFIKKHTGTSLYFLASIITSVKKGDASYCCQCTKDTYTVLCVQL